MQSVPLFVNFPIKSGMEAVNKVAVKLSGLKEVEVDFSDKGFTDIMGALMQIAPEELQGSLDRLAWTVNHTSEGIAAPVIDLSDRKDIDQDVLKRLLSEVMQADPSTPALVGSSPVEVTTVSVSDGLPEENVDQKAASSASMQIERNLDLAMPSPLMNENQHHLQDKLSSPGQTNLGKLDPTRSGRSDIKADPADSRNSAKPSAVPEVPKAPLNENSALKGELSTTQLKSQDVGLKPLVQQSDGLAQLDKTIAREPSPSPQVLSLPATANRVVPDQPAPNPGRLLKTRADHHLKIGRQDGSPPKAASGGPAALDAKDPLSARLAELPAAENRSSAGAAKKEWAHHHLPLNEERDSAPGGHLDESRAPGLRPGANKTSGHIMLSKPGSPSQNSALSGSNEHETTSSTRELHNNVMRQIVDRMTLRSDGIRSRMNIQLKPEFLGRVQMQISTEHQQVAVRMTTESLVVKEMIEQHLQHLRSELHQHGLEVDKFEVLVGNENENWKSSQENAGFRHALHQKNSRSSRQPDHGRERKESDSPDQPPPGPSEDSSEIDYFA